MAKARDIRRRMRSVESTRKITRTMEMVAASKLRRAQQNVKRARPYSDHLRDAIGKLVTPEMGESEPILRQPERVRRAAVLLITSDRGLCGGFNVNLIRRARELLDSLAAGGTETELHVVGKKGIGYFRFRGTAMVSERVDVGDPPTVAQARGLIAPLAERFVRGDLDGVHLVHAEFRSVMSAPPTARRLLPIQIAERRAGREPYFILDPSAEGILSAILPLYLTNATYRALVENAAAEQGARRTAMKSATDNAEEFLGDLHRSYNRARQAEITQQISEIIGGAEALSG